MGLVNLRNISLLVFSLKAEKLSEIKNVCAKSGYKTISESNTVQNTILLLKQKKVDVFLFDFDLGETKPTDFITAIKAAFPKLKIIPVVGADVDSSQITSLGIKYSLKDPITGPKLIAVLDQVAMEKMGITSSKVATGDDY